VRTSTVKDYAAVFTINAVYEEPVRFNMAFPFSFIVSMQGVVFVFGEQGLLINKQSYYFSEFAHVPVALFHQLAIFFEGAGECRVQHGLIV